MRFEKSMQFQDKEMIKGSSFIKLRKLKGQEKGKKRPKMKFQETQEKIRAKKCELIKMGQNDFKEYLIFISIIIEHSLFQPEASSE